LIGLILGVWLLFIFSVGGVIAFRFLIIPAEEEKLIAAFVKKYQQYRNRTGTLVPEF
jgi:protein-S-isoprenylcysteine O-methyltransferase Ste14